MSSPTLHVLPWSRPLLPQVVERLAGDWRGDGPLDLADTLVVTPTRHSGRRLREALARHAATHRQAVFPPLVRLPEQLVRPAAHHEGRIVASPHETLLAWSGVLLSVDLAEVDELIPIAPPARTFTWAARVARELLRVQALLGEHGLRIADVPERAGAPFPEAGRWAQLATLERRCDRRLAGAGRIDPQAARIAHARTAPPPEGVRRILIVGTPDPLPLALELVGRCAAAVSVEVLVHGPAGEDPAALFDAFGRPRVEAWARRPFTLPDLPERVRLCADPKDQARIVTTAVLQASAPEVRPAVGVADAGIVAPLVEGLRGAGVPVHDPAGRARRAGALFGLLAALAEFARAPSFAAVEALARHPDVLAWLGSHKGPGFSPARFLAELDDLRENHLPASLDEARAHGDPPGLRALAALRDALCGGDFAVGARAALRTIFAGRSFVLESGHDAAAVDAARAWNETLDAVAAAAAGFPGASNADLWELALAAFGETVAFEEKRAGAVEVLGWLELPWEDAPHLVVAGLNDGLVPAAIAGDAFLPESLRERLGLPTNAARLARDNFLLQALAASRAPHGRLDLLLGRTSGNGEPLRPSRVLLACADEELPGRIAHLFREVATLEAGVPWRRAWRLRPPPAPPPARLSVTAFRDHLECPFRFHLRHVLRMEPVDPRKAELDARDFGTLCHEVLETAALDPGLRDQTDPRALAAGCEEVLGRIVRTRFGPEPPLPVRFQLQSAHQRLVHAAGVLAAERARGWRVLEVETKFELPIAGMVVVGRIDRIEVHEDSGAVRVLDYKTSDRPVPAEEAHLRRPRADDPADHGGLRVATPAGERVWTNLQLPLYRLALRGRFGAGVACGYLNLPKAAGETGLSLWEPYPPDHDEAALACAGAVIDAIRSGGLPPPRELPARHDVFAALFHQGAAASVEWPAVAGEGRR